MNAPVSVGVGVVGRRGDEGELQCPTFVLRRSMIC